MSVSTLDPNCKSLEAMADEIFELYRLIALARSRRPTGKEELSEPEFLTLDELMQQDPQTIGDVQRKIGVVPAQMSRIVRSLEREGGKAFIDSRINSIDRRRIDISLTNEGKEAYSAYKANRLGSMNAILKVLQPGDRDHFMRILRQIRDAFSDLMATKTPESNPPPKK